MSLETLNDKIFIFQQLFYKNKPKFERNFVNRQKKEIINFISNEQKAKLEEQKELTKRAQEEAHMNEPEPEFLKRYSPKINKHSRHGSKKRCGLNLTQSTL